MEILGLIEIKLLSKKRRVLEEYFKNGTIAAIKMHKALYKSTLTEAHYVVKEWTGQHRKNAIK